MNIEDRFAALSEECLLRLATVEAAMRARSLSTLVVLGRGMITQYGHLQYLANYCPMIRVAALVLRAGYAPVLVLPTPADVVLARPKTPISDLRVASVGDDGTGVSSMARVIAELASREASASQRIGVVGLDDVLVASEFMRWKAHMPEIDFSSEGALLSQLKRHKSANELAEIKAAAETADAGFEALVGALRRGDDLRAAAGAAEAELRSQGAAEILVYISRGPHYRHRPPAGWAQPGDLLTVFVELASETGYWGEFARLIAVGSIDPVAERLAQHCFESMDLTERLLRPGATGASVFRGIAEHAKRCGYTHDASFGHGFGMDHDAPAIAARDTTVIDANSAISMHPQFLTMDGSRGASLGDAFIVTKLGAAALSRTPRGLIAL